MIAPSLPRVVERSTRASGVVAIVMLAFAAGYLAPSHARYAALLVLAPACTALVLRPQVAALLATAVLPVGVGVVAGGLNVSIADVLFLIAIVGFVAALAGRGNSSIHPTTLRATLLISAPFSAWLLVVATYHSSFTVLANTFQQFQLFLLPFVLGAAFMSARAIRTGLRAFVVVATALALIWITIGEGSALAGNKNPAGQFMGDAVLLVLLLAATQARWLVLLVPLITGLLVTGSRGALIGTGVGVIAFIAVRGLGTWRRTLAVVVPLGLIVLVGFNSLPDDVRARTTTLTAGAESAGQGSLTPGQYSLRVRETFSQEGWDLVHAHPVFGVGPGNYETGQPGTQEFTVDPHNVIIRTAGDSGYPGLVGFGLLVVGSAVLVLRRRRVSSLALAALAVQAAVLTHGLVDVYWVRGTPALGWLLLGMALNPAMERRSA